MCRITSISLREVLGLGSVGTMGLRDPASPDNDLFPVRTPGTIDRCTMFDPDEWDEPESCVAIGGHPTHLGEWVGDSIDEGQCELAENTFKLPQTYGTPAKITQKDFEAAAGVLKCEVAAIKAVAEVEARGSGFYGDGRPKILFEAHRFRLTKHVYDKLYPNISSPKWKKELYLGGVKEYDRLEQAMGLDVVPAIQSASWGAFQIMGFNYKAAGFTDPKEFVRMMYVSEGEHLKAFVSFVQANKLGTYIQQKDWEAFAKKYNGPKYKENLYDTKLAKAYAKHAGAGAAKSPEPKIKP